MTNYRVTDWFTQMEVHPGDTVKSYRGESAEFVCVVQDPEVNGAARIKVKWPGDETYEQEVSANAFHLSAEESPSAKDIASLNESAAEEVYFRSFGSHLGNGGDLD